MAYTIIENFKMGLDRRTLIYNAKPGALWTCDNAHINSGGEVEKRVRFEPLGLILNPSNAAYFGLVATSSSLYIFGSDNATVTVPSTVTYQRLQHPVPTHDAALYDATYHQMTEVVSATTFNDKPWVIAKFGTTSSRSTTWCFYDGTLVGSFRNGLILTGLTSVEHVALHIKDMFDTIAGFTVSTAVSPHDTNEYYVDVVGPVNDPIGVEISTNSVEGKIDVNNVDDGAAEVVGDRAEGRFVIIAGDAGGSVTDVEIETGPATGVYQSVMDTSNPIAWAVADTKLTFASKVADAINGFITDDGSSYSAQSDEQHVRIWAPATMGTDANARDIKVTVSDYICIDKCCFTFIAGLGAGELLTITINGVAVVTDVSVGPDLATAATTVAAAIRTASSVYTAVASGVKVYISRLISTSTLYGDTVVYSGSAADHVAVFNVDSEIPIPSYVLRATLATTTVRYPGTYWGNGVQWNLAMRSPLSVGVSVVGGNPGTESIPYPNSRWVCVSPPSELNMIWWEAGSRYYDPIFTSVGNRIPRNTAFVLRAEDKDGLTADSEVLTVIPDVITIGFGSG